jgi:hypothetical protein
LRRLRTDPQFTILDIPPSGEAMYKAINRAINEILILPKIGILNGITNHIKKNPRSRIKRKSGKIKILLQII